MQRRRAAVVRRRLLLALHHPFHYIGNLRSEICLLIGEASAPREVDDTDAAKARSMREEGINATDIARMLGVSRATVYRYFDTQPTPERITAS